MRAPFPSNSASPSVDSSFTVRAPGRVDLIGEHTDYNDGFVLPMALPLQTVLQLRARDDDRVELFSENLQSSAEFSLSSIEKHNDWSDYLRGVAVELQKLGIELRGFEGTLTSDVPTASGLSSSAALEVGAALAFLHVSNRELPRHEIALLCQRAENHFVGVNSGIMDQMAVAACKKGHALLLDCRSLETEHIPLRLENHAVIVTDSGAPRELASSAYNERRAQCETVVKVLAGALPQVNSLRDVNLPDLEAHQNLLEPLIYRRARHVVSEIARTQHAATALRDDDLKEFGGLMHQSHISLRDDYEVSSAELDWLVDWSMDQRGVLGSRLTGAGFGGCTVTLIEVAHAETFIQELPSKYLQATGRSARCWLCTAQDGASVTMI